MVQNRIVVHSDSAPVYTTGNRTDFLDKFCRDNGIDIHSIIGEVSEFTNYYVKFNGTYQHSLMHYHSDDEEYIFMDEIPVSSTNVPHEMYQSEASHRE